MLISNPFPSGITEPSGNAWGDKPRWAKPFRFSIRIPGWQNKPAGHLAFSANFGVAGCLKRVRRDKGYDIEITRNINALPNKYLSLDNSRTASQNANNTSLGGTVANPFL